MTDYAWTDEWPAEKGEYWCYIPGQTWPRLVHVYSDIRGVHYHWDGRGKEYPHGGRMVWWAPVVPPPVAEAAGWSREFPSRLGWHWLYHNHPQSGEYIRPVDVDYSFSANEFVADYWNIGPTRIPRVREYDTAWMPCPIPDPLDPLWVTPRKVERTVWSDE